MARGPILQAIEEGEEPAPVRLLLDQGVTNRKRYFEILAAVFRYGLAGVSDAITIRRHMGEVPEFRKDLQRLSRARRLRLLFEELGPTFIKIGQMLSTRPDLISQQMADEFGRLRDRTPPISRKDVADTIRIELGKPAEEAFKEFVWEPLATASIGQVHKAVLPDGTAVAVKVQRPGIARIIRADLAILERMASWIGSWVEAAAQHDPPGLVKEFRRMLEREIDYTIEARSIERFRKNFANFEGVVIPGVHWSHTTRRILSMDFMDGVSVDKVDSLKDERIDPQPLAQLIGKAYIKQLFTDGFFHADPHQGNIFVLRDGRICFLDFGAVGWLDQESRSRVAAFYVALVQRDVARAAEALAVLAGTDEVNLSNLEADLLDFLDFMELRRQHKNLPVGGNQRIVAIATAHGVSLPPTFVLLERALGQVEGVCRDLDPAFDIVSVAQTSILQVVKSQYLQRPKLLDLVEASADYRRLAREAPRRILRVLDDVEHGRLKVIVDTSFVDDLRRQVWRMALIVSVSIVMAALIYTATLTQSTVQVPLLGARVGVFAVLAVWVALVVLIYRRT